MPLLCLTGGVSDIDDLLLLAVDGEREEVTGGGGGGGGGRGVGGIATVDVFFCS